MCEQIVPLFVSYYLFYVCHICLAGIVSVISDRSLLVVARLVVLVLNQRIIFPVLLSAHNSHSKTILIVREILPRGHLKSALCDAILNTTVFSINSFLFDNVVCI